MWHSPDSPNRQLPEGQPSFLASPSTAPSRQEAVVEAVLGLGLGGTGVVDRIGDIRLLVVPFGVPGRMFGGVFLRRAGRFRLGRDVLVFGDPSVVVHPIGPLRSRPVAAFAS